MACPEFEDLLNGKCGSHALNCSNCRALLEAYAEVDSVFESAFAGISAPVGMAVSVRARIRSLGFEQRPSFLPEFLDSIGWAAVLATAAILLPQLTSFLSTVFTRLE